MAEQNTIRRVKLDDGTTAEYDGKVLRIAGATSGDVEVQVGGQEDENALLWLVGGYRSQRGKRRTTTGKAKGGRASAAVTEPSTVVPGGDAT
jgi:hypothetical protein